MGQLAEQVPLWKRVIACENCGSDEFAERLQAPDAHYGNAGLFRIVRCVDCGLHFLDPAPTADYLATAYPSDYYSYQPPAISPQQSRLRTAAVAAIRRLVLLRPQIPRDPKFAVPGRVLDIGCGTGKYLLEMREKGWKVHGVEINENAADAGRKVGLDIMGGSLLDAGLSAGAFDYIRLNHSFEHMENPREILAKIRRLLKPDGKLFIGVPNVRSFNAWLFGPYWFNLTPPVHVFWYSPRTLTEILRQDGFAVESVACNSRINGFTGSLQIFLNRHDKKLTPSGRAAANPLIKLIGHWITTICDVAGYGDCVEVIAVQAPAGARLPDGEKHRPART